MLSSITKVKETLPLTSNIDFGFDPDNKDRRIGKHNIQEINANIMRNIATPVEKISRRHLVDKEGKPVVDLEEYKKRKAEKKLKREQEMEMETLAKKAKGSSTGLGFDFVLKLSGVLLKES